LLKNCTCSGLDVRPVLHKCAHSNAFKWYPLILQKLLYKWRDRIAQGYNLGRNYHEMCKNDKNHRASVVARATISGFRQSGPFEKSAAVYLPHQLSPSGGRTLRPLHIWGDNCGQRRVFLLWET